MTRFAVLVLCPGATYSDLLLESRKHDVTVLEMLPFGSVATDYERHLETRPPTPVLFVLGRGRSVLVEQAAELPAALRACCSQSQEVSH